MSNYMRFAMHSPGDAEDLPFNTVQQNRSMDAQRYTHGSPDSAQQSAQQSGQKGPTYRSVGGVERQTTTDGVTTSEHVGPQAYSAAQINPHHGTDSVLATARSKSGRPVSEVVADTLVTINGIQAPAEFWRGEGWLTKGADGTYTETPGGPPAALRLPPRKTSPHCPIRPWPK